MSSTIEGSNDWAREDELDLGQEDEAPAPNGLNHASLRADDDPMGYSEGQAPDLSAQPVLAPNKHAVTNDSPPPPWRRQKLTSTGTGAAALGSPDETASTPDETPSLHVRRAVSTLQLDIC